VKRDEDWREKEKKKERAEKVGTCSFLFRKKNKEKTKHSFQRTSKNIKNGQMSESRCQEADIREQIREQKKPTSEL